MSKKLNKYIPAFTFSDRTLILLSATCGAISIISFTSAVGFPVGIGNLSFNLVFFLTTVITKKILEITRNKKKKT